MEIDSAPISNRFRKLPFEASDVGPPIPEATTLLMKRFSHQSSFPHQYVVRRDDDAIPACSGWGTDLSNKGLRIASIFIILACSMLGVFLPMMLARTSPNWRYSKISFFVFKYFGSGVILATAFMHLLSPAVEALSDDCLSGILPEYDWGHSICLMTIMIMFYIELMAARFNFGFGHSHGPATSPSDISSGNGHSHNHGHAHSKAQSPVPGMSEWHSSNNSAVSGIDGNNGLVSRSNLNLQASDVETATSSGRVSLTTDSSLNKKELTAGVASATPSPSPSPKPIDALASQPPASTASQHNGGLPTHISYPPGNQDHLAHGHDHVNGDSHASYGSQIVSLLILEFGVVFHSLFIGLSLAGSDSFTVLLIVIAFHQFFEGLGLGSRLAVATWPSNWKTWTGYLMATGYGFTTPLGIAIGLGVNQGLNNHPATAQLVNGIFDAVSSGILVYTALVELLAHEFMFNPEMRDAKLSVQMLAFLCVAVGVGLMSLLAKWA